ncbi:cadmium-translocating P-type ATPase [Lachnospiraceae bacterium WCA-9-b2]|uniref:Cd(2+)-exporting ATPase n=1 Tax=Sporofaciens musculi TaxID=2681861 RepID=A0A7X3SL13_9FIRM|nr:heavy metal translocating P-type ATPase [Sporofaciens musculi]MCI9421972.1 cadmium-translocating P-type ATPase [Dorea sp.]MXP78057.1 cadmium-translocating P-type ATPase [Sporofaciens musculi]
MSKQFRVKCIIYIAGIAVYGGAIAVSMRYTLDNSVKFIWFLAAYLIIGFETFGRLVENLMQKKLMTEYTLIVLATVGAIGTRRYTEGVFVMALFGLGMLFDSYTAANTKRTIQELINIRPEYATRLVRGREFKVDPSTLKPGHAIIIKPGERVPADAMVTYGISDVDTKALTGESLPQSVGTGDRIYSGYINLSAAIEAMVMGSYEDSAVTRIMKMVEDAQDQKAESENFVGAFSRFYTPVMLLCALAIMAYPSLTFSYGNWDAWIYRGLIFLVVACPCGLILSISLAFLGGIASAARQGIVVKGRNHLEDLAKADTFIFDKTGTLTEGVFRVKDVRAFHMTREELLGIAAHVESYSNHPIAQSLLLEYRRQVDKRRVCRMREMPGYGVTAIFDGERVFVGNKKLMDWQGILCTEVEQSGTVLYVAIGEHYAGYIVIEDSIKEDTKDTFGYLREKCNAVLVMLTGDTQSGSIPVARELEMDYAYVNLMPEDKLELVEDFLSIQDCSERLVCVGDGINDAPILARADVGIAMGAMGSEAAIEAADVILLEDDLRRIVDAIKIAKETLKVVERNVTFALFIKALVLVLSVMGYFSMSQAITAEVGVMFMALLNSAWISKYTV